MRTKDITRLRIIISPVLFIAFLIVMIAPCTESSPVAEVLPANLAEERTSGELSPVQFPVIEIDAATGGIIHKSSKTSSVVCNGNWQGPNAGFLTGWYAGNEHYAVYQDPIETGCLSTYPFAITTVKWRVTNMTNANLTIDMKPTIYSVSPAIPNCAKPGTQIFAGNLFAVVLPPLTTAIVSLPLGTSVCLNGPYFSGVTCPTLIGFGKLGINLDSMQVVPKRACANYNDFKGFWEDVITVYNFPGNVTLWSEGNNSAANSCPTGGNCCAGLTGNIDCDLAGTVDISDLTALIDHLFIS
ncbi:MAG: hypothetical protein SGI97_09380, partial [candidate division Zixibacteria bacterium]|nr:hypothetical protein [candidate division Zixibacteria bacterium]